MEANELRLGNYLYWKDEPMRIVDNYSLYKSCIDVSIGEERIKPIPLDEEWLLKFGFEAVFNGEYEILPFLYIWRTSSSTKSFLVSPNSDFPSTLEIKHVHQLQNLYFALTGEELTIKE